MEQHVTPSGGSRPAHLSVRQYECLLLAADGLTSAVIATRLHISARTVDDHLSRACQAYGVRTRVQAVARLTRDARRSEEARSFAP